MQVKVQLIKSASGRVELENQISLREIYTDL